jgi:hypothetical protein
MVMSLLPVFGSPVLSGWIHERHGSAFHQMLADATLEYAINESDCIDLFTIEDNSLLFNGDVVTTLTDSGFAGVYILGPVESPYAIHDSVFVPKVAAWLDQYEHDQPIINWGSAKLLHDIFAAQTKVQTETKVAEFDRKSIEGLFWERTNRGVQFIDQPLSVNGQARKAVPLVTDFDRVGLGEKAVETKCPPSPKTPRSKKIQTPTSGPN